MNMYTYDLNIVLKMFIVLGLCDRTNADTGSSCWYPWLRFQTNGNIQRNFQINTKFEGSWRSKKGIWGCSITIATQLSCLSSSYWPLCTCKVDLLQYVSSSLQVQQKTNLFVLRNMQFLSFIFIFSENPTCLQSLLSQGVGLILNQNLKWSLRQTWQGQDQLSLSR